MNKTNTQQVLGFEGAELSVRGRLLEFGAELDQLVQQVVCVFEGDIRKAAPWFRLGKPVLGSIPPRDMVLSGRTKRLARLVAEARK